MGADVAGGTQGPPPGFATLIPQPLAQAPERGAFPLEPTTRIVVRSTAPEASRVAQVLAASLRPATGYRLPVSSMRGAGSRAMSTGSGSGISQRRHHTASSPRSQR